MTLFPVKSTTVAPSGAGVVALAPAAPMPPFRMITG